MRKESDAGNRSEKRKIHRYNIIENFICLLEHFKIVIANPAFKPTPDIVRITLGPPRNKKL